MTYTSDRPISVDGVRLDTLAWNVEKITRATAGRRTADVVVPGRDGVIPSVNDDLEPLSFGLDMFVMGTDADGAVPADRTRRDMFRANLDELVHLFGKRHALLELRESMGGARRVNVSTNPRLAVDAAGWTATPGTGGVLSTNARMSDGSPVGPDYYRVAWSTAPTGGNARISTSSSALGAVTPGVETSAGVWVRPSVAKPITLILDFNSPAGWVHLVTRGHATLQPNVWSWVTISAIPQATVDRARLHVMWTSPTQVAPGELLDATGVVLGPGPAPAAYFDGDGGGPGGAGHAVGYRWTGAPHASTSEQFPRDRRALAKVQDAITPDVATTGSSGRFTVGLTIPSGVWEDAELIDWDSGPVQLGQPVEVTTLRGGTERVTDAVLLLQGPLNNPQVTDAATGCYVRLNKALAAGECWRVNVATWSTRTGNGLTLDGPDNTGADAQHLTEFGGAASQAAFLPLVPVRDPVASSPLETAQDGTPYVTSQAGNGTVVGYDEDTTPYATTLAEQAGQALAYDTDQVPYLTGGGATIGGGSTRRTRVVVSGSGATTNTRLFIRARRKFAL